MVISWSRSSISFHPSVTNSPCDLPHPEKSNRHSPTPFSMQNSCRKSPSMRLPDCEWQYTRQGQLRMSEPRLAVLVPCFIGTNSDTCTWNPRLFVKLKSFRKQSKCWKHITFGPRFSIE